MTCTQAEIDALTDPATGRVGLINVNGTAVVGWASARADVALAHMATFPSKVPIPQAEFAKLAAGTSWIWNGTSIAPAPAATADLATALAAALNKIEAQAAQERSPRSAPGPWQVVMLLYREAEAIRLLALKDPTQALAVDFPLLAALGDASLLVAARGAIAHSRALATRLAAIEVVRLAARRAISQAASVAEVAAALSAVVWPVNKTAAQPATPPAVATQPPAG